MHDGIEEVYGRKVSERRENLSFLGRVTTWYWYQTGVIPVPNRGDTGTKQGWCRYHLGRGKMVPVPLTITGSVLVSIQVVPVPTLPTAPIFVFL